MAGVSLEKDKVKFLLIEDVHQKALRSPRAISYASIEFHKNAPDDERLEEFIHGTRFISLRSRTHLTEDVTDAAERLVAIDCFCTETNRVDPGVVAKREAPVSGAPFSNTRSVMELVIGGLLLLLRDVPEASAKAHRGMWNGLATGFFEVRGKKPDIIGHGHIDTQLGILAESPGMYIYFYDIENRLPLGNVTQAWHLSDLSSMSGTASLHVPENPSTKNMMGVRETSLMEPGSLLINASRGTMVDTPALCDTLTNKYLTGVAIDVFPTRPAASSDPFIPPLCEFDNVLLTPHIGDSAQGAQENIGLKVAGKLIKYSDSDLALPAMNFPEASLPLHDRRRLIHIYENHPGVLITLNKIFVGQGINIVTQYLQTPARTGYVVIDIETDEDVAEKALQTMKTIPDTIHARLLY